MEEVECCLNVRRNTDTVLIEMTENKLSSCIVGIRSHLAESKCLTMSLLGGINKKVVGFHFVFEYGNSIVVAVSQK